MKTQRPKLKRMVAFSKEYFFAFCVYFFFSGLWEIDFLYLSLFYVIFSTRILSFIADYCSAVAFP